MAYAMRLANRASALSLLRPAKALPTACLAPMSGMTAKQAAATEHFFNKNRSLKRPLSPHLSIYASLILVPAVCVCQATNDVNAFTDPQGNWLWHGSIMFTNFEEECTVGCSVRDSFEIWTSSCVHLTFVYGMGVMPLVCSHHFPHYVEVLRAMHISPVLTFPVKLGLAFALCYHTFNGMRHMAWDLGLGFGLKELYATGYFVLALSLATGAVLAFK